MNLIRISPIIGFAAVIAMSSAAIARPTTTAHPIIRPAPPPITRTVAPHMIFHHVDSQLAPRPLPFPPPVHHPTPPHPIPNPHHPAPPHPRPNPPPPGPGPIVRPP